MYRLGFTLFTLVLGCSDKSASETGLGDDTSSGGDTSSSGDATCLDDADWADAPQCSAWRINTDAASTYIDGVLSEIQSATVEEVDGEAYIRVETQVIPAYVYTLTDADSDALTDRPNASSDFVSGSPTVSAGDEVEFAQNIGYKNPNCGLGFWPPGPECPAGQDLSGLIPLEPVAAGDTDCETGSDRLGLWVSGTAIYGWTDTQSYNNDGVWQNMATKLEVYDIDICGGHSGFGGEYHHHGSSLCLIEQLDDDGSGHSPVYGLAADGYPVYGPWQDTNSLAQSCWQTRDYDSEDSETGCGVAGERSCLLVDPTDPSAGTEVAATNGPSTSDTVVSMSSNEFLAESGFYFEDYWFDTSCPDQGGAYLDVHNGHDHDDLGYHYHVTVEEQDDGTFLDVFPMHVGPSFAGELSDDSLSSCH